MRELVPEPGDSRLDVPANPHVVVIGGGGGTAAVYPEIARRTENATAIVGTFDSGGSTGRLKEQLDLPIAVGDLRQVTMAASSNRVVQMMYRHRYSAGDASLRGHSMGNLNYGAFIQDFGVDEGVELANEFFQVRGQVLPVSLLPAELVLEDGPRKLRGEHNIDEYSTAYPPRRQRISLDPAVPINPKAEKAIAEADLVLIPGGSINTSLLAALVVDGVARALRSSRAPKVLLANLATEPHQTHGWHVADFVEALERHDIDIDAVLYNNRIPDPEVLAKYEAKRQYPVDFSPEGFDRIPFVRAIGAPLLSHMEISPNPHDAVERSLMRHDAEAVSDELWKLMAEMPAAAA